MAAQNQTEQFLPKEPLDLPSEPLDLPNDMHELKTLLSWKAPGRPFRKRGKEYYLTSLLLTLFIEIILFLFSQYMLMVVVLSFVFAAFALVTVPPHDFKYRLSTEGITIEDHFYLWQELYDFYFKKREGIETLHVRTKTFLPGELIIMLGDLDKKQLTSLLLQYLPYREIIKPTFMEKSADWLARTFPLERKTT
ncbi:MAG: hypothetical protein HYV37_00325 [Candidatus Levyibacteriota bacterium]|nr:MAG: hypothetical protein HYV37_00325 [Candidatus Levybacteria bacterium]